jgi:hypothetical protein
MANPVSNVTHVQAQPAVNATPVRQPAAQPKPQPPATDTVQISAAAQTLQEATETGAQTAREASAGDVQAQRLLAKHVAAYKVGK